MSKPASTPVRVADGDLVDEDQTELWEESDWQTNPNEDDALEDALWDGEAEDLVNQNWNTRSMAHRPSPERAERRHGQRRRAWERFKRTVDYQETWYGDRPRTGRPTRR